MTVVLLTGAAWAMPRPIESLRLLLFTSKTCGSCRRFEASGVPDKVAVALPKLTLERVDIAAQESLVTKYGVEVTPTLVLVDADGFPLARPRITLDDPDGTTARVVALVKKMIR
jgi:hypothetical protein